MTLKLLNLLTGYHIVTVPTADAEKVLNVLLRYQFIHGTPQKSAAGITFSLIARHRNDFCRVCADQGLCVEVSTICGLPRLFSLYRRRWGIVVGVLYFFVMLWGSGLFIWDIQVTGNQNVKDAEVIDLLHELGCGVGSYIPAIDFDELHNDFLRLSPNVAWIAVNMSGVVAEVEVREILRGGEHDGEKNAANIVAAADGQIDTVEVFDGKRVVAIGDIVRKGDLLISGVVAIAEHTETPGVRYTQAAGKVLARVNKSFSIEVPLEQEKKTFTGQTRNRYLINIFGKSINLSSNSGISDATYDKIVNERKLTVFGEVTLPVNVVTETYSEYTIERVRISEEEAVEIAFTQLRDEMDAALAGEDTELLEREIETSFDGERFTLVCRLYCLENIAQTVPFSVH